ncbi:MAG: cyclic nucleotide-binding domain-containing protein, partial [Acidobacteriota bacterium]|nr:cyclic nucleotide-binding domain-containing protein [Acidobacteriota bacterium]
MEDRDERTQNSVQVSCPDTELYCEDTVIGLAKEPTDMQMPRYPRRSWNDPGAEWRAGEIYKGLSPKAMNELESFAAPYCCGGATMLFSEEEEPHSLLFLIEGRVKLSMNTSGSKRFTLGFAVPGDVLGLAAVVTGSPYEVAAVAQFPCRIRALPRENFLGLLLRYPDVCSNSARLLAVDYKRGCDQLRILGLAMTASIKLAMLLLQW